MEPRFYVNDTVILSPTAPIYNVDYCYVNWRGGVPMLGRVERQGDGWLLSAINRDGSEFVSPDDIMVMAKAVTLIRRFD